jgi:hypothetical protein
MSREACEITSRPPVLKGLSESQHDAMVRTGVQVGVLVLLRAEVDERQAIDCHDAIFSMELRAPPVRCISGNRELYPVC